MNGVQPPMDVAALRAENERLRIQLDEAEQTLNAIRQGAVDALVIADHVFTLDGSDKNYRLLVESIGEGALTATRDGTIVYCNSKFAQMVSQPSEKIVGHCITDFVKTDERVSFQAFLRHSSHDSLKREVTLQNSAGVLLSTQASLGLLDAEGLSGICVILTDLTETKMAAQLVHANQDLSRSNSELARFAFVASHDLKEPLRVVSNYVQMIQRRYEKGLDAEAHSYIGFIVQAVRRMYDLIDDLLNYSRVGADPTEFGMVDCTHVVQDVLLNLRPLLDECGGTVDCGNLPQIEGDRNKLLQLFQNLVGNGLKYRSAAPPKISIRCWPNESNWIFSVSDNGIGIKSEYFDKIFVLFQRLHRRDQYTGTGIGLSICKKVVEQHGGRIWVESELGQGSTFFFSLPIRDNPGGLH